MAEYHTRTSPSSSQSCSTPILAKKFGLGELAQRYGLADIMDFSQSNHLHANQIIDEEFLEYTTVTFGLTGVADADILAFWEVSSRHLPCSLLDLIYALHHREMNRGSRRSMQSH